MRPTFLLLLAGLSAALLPGQTTAYTPPAFTIDTVAGSGWIGDGGPAVQAVLEQPQGVCADWAGNLYVAEAGGHRVRKISAGGIITTVAGTGEAGFSGDGGPASVAQLNAPYGVTADLFGNLYIADLGNSRVRKVAQDGTISTVAGGGTLAPGGADEGKAATSIALSSPRNVVADYNGNLYISDFAGQRVFELRTDGTLTTIAGTGTAGYSGDSGDATMAQLNFPTGVAIDYQGSLYIGDSQNGVVRRVAAGVISTFGQVTTPTGMTFDQLGNLRVADAASNTLIEFSSAGTSTLQLPASDVALGLDTNLYVADANAGVVRAVAMNGSIRVAVGAVDRSRGDGGQATLALLNHPSGVTADPAGNFYIADRDNNKIRKVTPDGTIATIAGTGTAGNTGDGNPAAEALLNAPEAVSVDAAGDVYVADTGNHRVRVITPSGAILAVAGNGTAGATGDGSAAINAELNAPSGVVPDNLGNVYIADTGNGEIRRVDSNGTITTILSGLASPRGLAADPTGAIYFTEQNGKNVGRWDPATGIAAKIAPGSWNVPRGAAVDSSGDLYVADSGLEEILRVDSNGAVSIAAGTGAAGFTGDAGQAANAELNTPWDLAIGTQNQIYIADFGNNRVRRLSAGIVAPAAAVQILNAASLAPTAVAPGMLLSLQSTGLHASDAATTQILVNSIPVRIQSMDDTQILIQAPMSLDSVSAVEIVIVANGNLIAAVSAAGAAAAPALFADASGQASATNADGSINGASNPAAEGSNVSLFGTGFGLGDLPVAVSVGGVSATVISASPVAAFPGMFQVNVQVPSGLTAGSVPVIVSVGGIAGPAAMIAVK